MCSFHKACLAHKLFMITDVVVCTIVETCGLLQGKFIGLHEAPEKIRSTLPMLSNWLSLGALEAKEGRGVLNADYQVTNTCEEN